MKETDLAWAAGIVDGEGCIHISRHRPSKYNRTKTVAYALILKVTMCHKETVSRLRKIFGFGAITSFKQHKWTRAFSWNCSPLQAGTALRLMRPFLVTKAREADTALEFLNLPSAPRGGPKGSKNVPYSLLRKREHYYKKLRALKPSARFRK